MTLTDTITRRTLAVKRKRPLRSRIGEIDIPLAIGLAAILALLLVALYGPIVATHDPFETHQLYRGKLPPFDPSPEFPLGTDALGRDRLSWLLYGARMTFTIALAAAALRVGVGVFLGIFAAWQGRTSELLLARVALALSSVPATIAACLALLAFNVNAGALAFILGLSVVGWVDAFHHARRATKAEIARPYMESARALGASDERLVLVHLMPNLAPSLLTLSALQVSAVLLLLGELALLRIFFGGPVSSDLFGSAVVLPSQPEWSSTLGATRPIYDLFGNALAVLAPGGALLVAVIAFNLFGDALARRAQRLDLFHLFSARQWIALSICGLAIVSPVLVWPGRLAMQVAYADAFDAARALALTRELGAGSFADRVTQSSDADAAAHRLALLMGGNTIPIEETILRIDAASLSIGEQRVTVGPDLSALSQQSASVHGELVLTEALPALTRPSTANLVRGKIALVRNVATASVASVTRVLLLADAAAIVILSDEAIEQQSIPTPMFRLSPARLREILGAPLPDALGPSVPVIALGVEATVDLAITVAPVHGKDAILRVPSTHAGAPLFVVVAPYDQAEYASYISTRAGWPSASAAAVLVAAADRVRLAPIDADVIFVAAGAQSFDQAGMKAALRSLQDDERARLATVIVIQSAQTSIATIRPDPAVAVNPGGGPSIAGRIASATGQRYQAQRSEQVLRGVLAVGLRVPTFELDSRSGTDAEPSLEALRASGRLLLVLLHYLAGHLDQLRG
jgi:ABC-type dipeptide/oligopeptide/nickel transport system permease subunit